MRILTGFHAIEETLRSVDAGRGELYLAGSGSRQQRLADAAKAAGVRIHNVQPAELDKMAPGKDHRGAVYLAKTDTQPRILDFTEAISSLTGEQAMVVVLDQITDPHNLGAILRSSDQFGADLIVLPSRRSAHVTDTVA
ncbi:MAG: 23S rRNA (guanosine(2251)-2'-O)-methyltransferase RlmB, partial [Spirochaetales bacterium]|nr:23S rRNA (guanosine(2251)-2'-O)-methyltransferase RlmB [Spirochaetales bacterium]